VTLRSGKEIAEEILQNLKTDVEFILSDGRTISEVIDLNLIINGLNLIKTDPAAFFKSCLVALSSLKILYTNLQEVTDTLERERDVLVNSKRVQFSSSDDTINPFAKTHKLTAAVVDALINELTDVKALEEEIAKSKNGKRRVWNLVEVVQKVYDVGQALLSNIESLPMSGIVATQEDRAILEAEVAKLDKENVYNK